MNKGEDQFDIVVAACCKEISARYPALYLLDLDEEGDYPDW